MLELLIGIIVGVALIAILFFFGNAGYEWYNTLSTVVASMLTIPVGCFLIFYCVSIFEWIASEHKANILNREYGTSYTREEVFYASNVIDTIRELDRKRVELNGDIMRDKDGSR